MFARRYFCGEFFAPRYFPFAGIGELIVTAPVGRLSLALAYYPTLFVGLAMSSEIPLTLAYQDTEELRLTAATTLPLNLAAQATLELFLEHQDTLALIMES